MFGRVGAMLPGGQKYLSCVSQDQCVDGRKWGSGSLHVVMDTATVFVTAVDVTTRSSPL